MQFQIPDIVDAYKQYDSNNDGLLDEGELLKIFKSPELVQKILEKGDLDHNGTIDFIEFNALALEYSQITDETLLSAFNYFDNNKDLFITAEEMQNFVNVSQKTF